MAGAKQPTTQSLNGIRKAAIICMALGKEQGAKAIQMLSPQEIEAVGREIASLGSVPGDVVETVLSEFQSNIRAMQADTRGGVDYAREVLETALGADRGGATVARIKDKLAPTPIGKLNKTHADTVANVLKGEHPQAIALVLARLDPARAAGVLEKLDPALSADVIFRMARMEKVAPEMVAAIEAGLGSKADLTPTTDLVESGGPDVVAQMLNCISPEMEQSLLGVINEKDAELATQIRERMFVFEDLMLFDGKAMQRLLREVDTKELALALKVVSDQLKQHIFKNMSERAGAAVQEEIEIIGAVKVKDVEAAHQRIVATVRTLQEAGEMPVVRRGGSADDVV